MVGVYRSITTLLAWGTWPARVYLGRRPGGEWSERAGALPTTAGGVWIHAASAGEVRGIVSLARRIPEAPVLVTAHTRAGVALAAKALPETRVARAPFDLPDVARKAIQSAAPGFLLIAETELWPNLILEAARRGIPVGVVNGRISDRTIGRYAAFRRLTAPVLGSVAVIGAQSDLDRDRFVSLGARAERVTVTGNMKHDVPAVDALPAALPWNADPVIVAGSLRDEEEEIVAEALLRVRERVPGIRMIAAPRHLHRRSNVGRAFHRRGFRVGIRSESGPGPEDQVLVLDTMGELLSFYAAAQVAVVGGTLLPFGGHNLMEPAALGIPVVHGPFVANCRLEAEALARNGASAQANTIASLAEALEWFLLNPEARSTAAEAGQRTVRELSGATDRTIRWLERWGAWPA